MGTALKTNRCVILGAAPIFSQAKQLVHPSDYIIAADGGWQTAQQMGWTTNCILGDFDSSPCPERENVIVLPTEKDDTDTHYATKLAISEGFRDILYLGVLGGMRLDHMLGALQSAYYAKNHGAKVLLSDGVTQIQLLQGPEKIILSYLENHYFSVIPWFGTVDGVSIEGGKYAVKNVQLTPDYPLGVSNEFVKDSVTISIKKGSLLVITTPK